MPNTLASLDGTGAALADTCRQRARNGNGRVIVQACGISLTQCSKFSENASVTASQGLHQTQQPPRHERHRMGRGTSLQCTFTDACRDVTSRASQSRRQAPVTEGLPQHYISEQRGALQPDWWQRLSRIAAACAVAALLTAGGPCSPAEARARLTQVSTSSFSAAT